MSRTTGRDGAGDGRASGAREARYSEIEAQLRREIAEGVFPTGSHLPTEHALCTRFQASRFTVRQAIAGLREAGLVEARAGVGTLVLASRPPEAFVQTLSSVEELLQYPAGTRRKNLRTERVRADDARARLLSCPVGQEWVRLEALRLPRGARTPIAWLEAYLTPALATILDEPNPKGAPLVRQIEEEFAVKAARAQIEIFAGHITPDLAGPLAAEEGEAAMIILRRYRGSDGEVFLVTRSVHPQGRFSLNVEFERR